MTLLHMSFYGAVIILAVILIRTLTLHKLPKKIFLILWGIALLRLLMPFEIPSTYSLYSLLPAQQAADISQPEPAQETFMYSIDFPNHSALLAGPPVEGEFTTDMSVLTAPAPDIPEKPESSFVKTIVPYFWCAGMVLSVLYFAISYFRCHREFCTSLPIRDDYILNWLDNHPLYRTISVRQSDLISTPLTYGIFRPVILLPKSMDTTDREQLDYVLLHEFTHIRRFDQVTKLFLIAALCLHWFNPFVWVMYLLFNRDLELSCDESVLQNTHEERSSYAMTLIHMEETRSHTAPLFSHFSQNALEERIVAIMKMQRLTLGAALFSFILILVVVLTLTTSAKAAEPDPRLPIPTVTPTPTPDPGPTATPSPTPDPGPTATPPLTPDPGPTVTPLPVYAPENGCHAAIVKGCMENVLMLDFVDYDISTGKIANKESHIISYPVAKNVILLLTNSDAVSNHPDNRLITNSLSVFISSVYTEDGWSKKPYFFEINDGVITEILDKFIP